MIELLELLSQFYKRPYCQAYSKPAKQIELLAQYLWVRQIVPTLSIEAFLDGFAKVADADTENCKEPLAALNAILPRRKPKDQPTAQTFSVEQHLTALTTYTETLRYLDTVQQPVPMTFADFIRTPAVQEKLLDGSFVKRDAQAVKPKEVVPPPTSAGSRCIYTDETGREQRGRTLGVDLDSETAEFEADSGELFLNVSLTRLTVSTDPPPRKALNQFGEQAEKIATQTVQISPDWWANYTAWVGTKLAIPSVPEGEELHVFRQQVGEHLYAMVGIRNHPVPVIDARLVLEEPAVTQEPVVPEIVCELQPRQHVLGEYRFPYGKNLYILRLELQN